MEFDLILLLNLISLINNIAQFDDQAVRRPRGATTARHDRAGWTGKNLILDEALPTPFSASPGNILARQQLRAKTKSHSHFHHCL